MISQSIKHIVTKRLSSVDDNDMDVLSIMQCVHVPTFIKMKFHCEYSCDKDN